MAKPPKKVRADQLVVGAGLAGTTKEAAAIIMTGKVMATDGKGREAKVKTAGQMLDRASTFRVAGKQRRFVSRGGEKLEAALDAFELDVTALICADIGLSTGGFTDCLLQRGAQRVHGVDVAYGHVAWKIRTDPKVVLHERTNARHLTPGFFDDGIQLMGIDVSFMRLAPLLGVLAPLVEPGATIVALVKPQFELPDDLVPDGGVVRDEEHREQALQSVLQSAEQNGLGLLGRIQSPITGADGNVEYLLGLKRE